MQAMDDFRPYEIEVWATNRSEKAHRLYHVLGREIIVGASIAGHALDERPDTVSYAHC